MKKWMRPTFRAISADQLHALINVAARSIICELRYVR